VSFDRNSLPPLRALPALRFPDITHDTLVNGVELSVVDHREDTLVTFVLLLRAGAAFDPPGREGLSGFTADMIDEGSETRTALSFHEVLGDMGGHFGTNVISDATVLSVTALAQYSADALAMLIDAVTAPRFDTSDVDRVRGLRVNGIMQLQHSAAAVADGVFLSSLYGQHPYGHRSIGTKSALMQIGLNDLRSFHEAHYAPQEWRMVAAGGASKLDLSAIIKDCIAQLRKSPSLAQPESTAPTEPSTPLNRLIFVPRNGAVQTELRIGLLGVDRRCVDYDALTVMNMVLGGQFVSRLNLNLREKKGYTYGVRSSFDARRGRGPFVVRAAVDASETVNAIREIVRDIRDIRDVRPVTERELVIAKSALTRGFSRSFETADQVAHAAMRLAVFDLPDDEYTTFVPRIESIERSDVTLAARDYLDPDDLVVVAVGPPTVRVLLGDIGLGDPIEPLID